MIQIINCLQPDISLSILAQTSTEAPMGFIESLSSQLGGSLVSLGQAVLILVVGLFFANWSKGQTKKWLQKTDIDNKIAAWIAGESDTQSLPIEEWIAEAVGWIITLFVAIAFLNALKLDVVSEPLNALLQEVTKFLPKIGGAALLIVLAWVLATVVKLIVTKSLQSLEIDQKINQQVSEESAEGQLSLSETIASTLYWFIFLLFLPSILSVLQLEGTLGPLQEMVNNILSIIPNIFAAVIIGAVGWVIAQIIKKVVTNLLTAAGVNQIGEKFGLSSSAEQESLSQIIGSIVYVLVLIPTAITALDALQIQAISVPATQMLNQVLDILPKLFAATVILGLAYVGGQYISKLVTDVMESIGFNNIFQWLGISQPTTGEAEIPTDESTTQKTPTRTPSELVGMIVLIAIMLVAALTAVDILQIEALKNVVSVILLLAAQVLVGVVIFGVGLYFANLAFNLIKSSGTRQAMFLAQTARIAIIVLVSAMALERIGIAPNIVNLAFGLLTGGIAVAIALAFGLGGREAAGKALQEWLDSFKQ